MTNGAIIFPRKIPIRNHILLNIINDLHDSKQVKNINIIINDYIVSSSSYGYGYGYGYGSGYGYYE